MAEFVGCWKGLDDPRTGNTALHDFHELLMIVLCTVLCGGQCAVDMALFARAEEPFLRGFLKLENGLPSHDTFSRLFRQIDPVQVGAAFQRFMARFSKTIEGVVAIDGKVLRRCSSLRESHAGSFCLKGGIVRLGASLDLSNIVRTGAGSLPLLAVTDESGLGCALWLGKGLGMTGVCAA